MDEQYEAVKLFIKNISEEELIYFIIGQNDAITGLVLNNKTYREAFQKMVSS